ncbi:hypothetical protein H8N03_21720 [Ramlibacter sp. USB13]|uniref:Uncharacterized protein n=1 Tax=Ramlibacter cellulosilyticus TaxID=2764187 RepID=A0A923SD59_9BURK|nr:hypothetical protein [Ramlibacter cellulosilyticus]MBC5785574.1 hypothetical protein [Ramlibacter cellulosilyticus]
MIQLATDPNASRSNWRPAASEAKDNTLAGRRSRSGHAWPFIAQMYVEPTTPSSQAPKRTPTSESGS